MNNYFVKPAEEYTRDLNVIKHYLNDATMYLHKQTGKPLEQCRQFVIVKTKRGGDLAITDPDTLCLTRRDDIRVKEVIPFSEYIKDIAENNLVMAPTLTVYLPKEQKPSLLSEFIEVNIGKRKKSKNEMFVAKTDGNEFLANFKNNEQQSFKIANNSLSGAHASQGTILYNRSSHSSLTSTCRTATSYANANNEKFLMGNRHYWKPDIVKANILNIVNHADLESLSEAISFYNIAIPTVEQVMDSIEYSVSLYWDNKKELDIIRGLVNGLTGVERAGFLYIGDLYHLAKYNNELVRGLISEMSEKAQSPLKDPSDYVGILNDDTIAFVSLLCTEELSGTSLRDLKKDSPEKYAIVEATAKKTLDILDKYKLLIQSLWTTDCLPPSVASIRSSVRRAVVTSDTDSTIFTTQYWTEWFTGKLDFSDISKAVSYTVTYLATQTITHILATVSAGFGVAKEHLHTLAMKNEFAFPTFALTSMAKHYYAYVSACEGSVYSKYDTEIKGVQLKDSNAPKYIMDEFDNTLKEIMDTVISGELVSIIELKTKIANIEYDIMDSVKRGSSDYLKNGSVKDMDSYVNPNVSPYAHYIMWQDVFAIKYGDAPDPPYQAIRVQVAINSKAKVNSWLDSLEDQELAQRFRDWMQVNKKSNVSSFLLPKSIIEISGLPSEIVEATDVRKIVYTTVRPYYLLLESLGIYMINNNLTKLVSDDPQFKRNK